MSDQPATGPIESAARTALAEVMAAGDAVTKLRCEIVFAAARNIDTPKLAYQLRANAEALRIHLADVVESSPVKGGAADELAAIVEQIRGSGRG